MTFDGFNYFLAGRANQDCLENVFSLLRVKHKKMGPVQFKQNLFNHALSQYMYRPIANTSYFWDNSSEENQVNILKILREKVPAQKTQAPKLKLSTFQVLHT